MIREASAAGVPSGTHARTLPSNLAGTDVRQPVSMAVLKEIKKMEEERLIAVRTREGPGAGGAPGRVESRRSGGLLFRAQFTYFAHAPLWVFSLFVRLQPN